jgi:hypothetical protein
MVAKCWRMARRARLIGKTLPAVVMVCSLTDVACSQGRSGTSTYDVTRRRLDEIPAGTVIDKEAPRGWTNLIIKSRARPGAMDALPPAADRLSRMLDRDERDNLSGPAEAIRRLPPNVMDDCVLHVDGKEVGFAGPTERAFAMAQAVKGEKEIPVGDLKPLVARQRFSPALAADLEAGLREARKQAASK